MEFTLSARTILICIFIFSANSILAADKTSIESTVVLEQQVFALQKEVATLKTMLEKITEDQSKQQSYIQISKDELIFGAAKNVTVSAKNQLTLKSGDASIVLKNNGEVIISGTKYDVRTTGDTNIKGLKIKNN